MSRFPSFRAVCKSIIPVLIVALVGCSVPALPYRPVISSNAPVELKIQSFAYHPPQLTVPIGTTVKWTQYDTAAPHTVSAGSPSSPEPQAALNSPTLTTQGDDTYSFTFTQPGIYPYYCIFHLEMTAAIIVTNPDGSVPTPAASTPAATPTPYTAPLPVNAQVIVSGLINPRGFTMGPDGDLYVAEAGTVSRTVPATSNTVSTPTSSTSAPASQTTVNPICEGNLPSYDKQRAGCPGAQGPQVSDKGRISKIAPDGTRTTVAEHLPVTVGPFGDVFGVNAVAFVGNDLYVIIAAGETRGHPDFPTGVYKVNADGTTTMAANLEAFQKANPPKFIPEDYDFTLPYDMVTAMGKLYITDGNAAVVFEVDPSKPNGSNIQRIVDLSPTHNVLTGATANAQGTIYFTEFTPAPYPVGGAQIFKWSPQGGLATVTGGLSIATGLAIAPDGTMYATEFATALGKPPYVVPPGRLVKVTATGQVTDVANPLVYPTSLRWLNGALYTTNYGVNAVDGEPGHGVIYKITP